MSHDLKLNELPSVHGALAAFDTPESLLAACHTAREAGYKRMDAYAPMPVNGLAEAIGYKKNYVALCVLIAGICGVCGGLGLLEWICQIAYPHNVGGRPLNSWPEFIPITFECMILASALTSLFSMLAMNGLPQYYHPVFNVAEFARASVDKFFLCIESSDPKFSTDATVDFLRSTGAKEVSVVPA